MESVWCKMVFHMGANYLFQNSFQKRSYISTFKCCWYISSLTATCVLGPARRIGLVKVSIKSLEGGQDQYKFFHTYITLSFHLDLLLWIGYFDDFFCVAVQMGLSSHFAQISTQSKINVLSIFNFVLYHFRSDFSRTCLAPWRLYYEHIGLTVLTVIVFVHFWA